MRSHIYHNSYSQYEKISINVKKDSAKHDINASWGRGEPHILVTHTALAANFF
jgi:hypothetical protein